MRKTTIAALVLAFLCASFANAQAADKVTEMIKTDKATWGQVCYFSAVYLGLTDEDSSTVTAAQALVQEGFIKPVADVNSPITLEQIAYICAKTWKIKGSLLYTIFPCPRYAFRMLKADGIIPATADPMKISTGHETLNIFNACMGKFSVSEESK